MPLSHFPSCSAHRTAIHAGRFKRSTSASLLRGHTLQHCCRCPGADVASLAFSLVLVPGRVDEHLARCLVVPPLTPCLRLLLFALREDRAWVFAIRLLG